VLEGLSQCSIAAVSLYPGMLLSYSGHLREFQPMICDLMELLPFNRIGRSRCQPATLFSAGAEARVVIGLGAILHAIETTTAVFVPLNQSGQFTRTRPSPDSLPATSGFRP
jgi:hypothetical protein